MTTLGTQRRAEAPTVAPGAAISAAPAPLPLPALPAAGTRYAGRFAPSPTGPLHAGSLVAALASWLDARAAHQGRGGRWLIRIEDVDTPRCSREAATTILAQLAACGLQPDAPPVWQSNRNRLYQNALDSLVRGGHAYPCGCSRKDIEEAHAARGHARERHALLPYPGTCRTGLDGRPARSWRFAVPETDVVPGHPRHNEEPRVEPAPNVVGHDVWWHDRRLGWQTQNVATAVGDFVLRRADALWAYQLAVVVDDGGQGITDVVRGADLADNTARQILLQRALGLPAPRYLHTPLVCGPNGEKLSKQNGAQALNLDSPVRALAEAAQTLGLPALETGREFSVSDALAHWANAWGRTYNHAP